MTVKINILQPDDLEAFHQLVSVFEEVFEMKPYAQPGKAHLATLLQQGNFWAVVARVNNKVIGGLTVYVLQQYYSTRPLAYIYDLAVLTAYQRKGIGKRLLAFITHFCRQQGFEEVFVQADKVDAYALDFYRQTSPTAQEEVVHFYYKLQNDEPKPGDEK